MIRDNAKRYKANMRRLREFQTELFNKGGEKRTVGFPSAVSRPLVATEASEIRDERARPALRQVVYPNTQLTEFTGPQ